ncbi:hypothetical protein BEL04_14100 [Mucilaginibacter sp. PPCGB 2223]|uniref:hypothetical protein n=1 Tax=Mucilaginibacter sp. PPCGB 2223 TaxID=1886027 RepID=UPI000824ACE8|nr:hypothetical protein [Mucilaginibacter sp. PPCGB 2223]OCX52579.1 hypothetical protein BEL04_14095 [Mucilaginibacter sp. PPCGB 2223]OCX52580.1 hypothetical protein BEL04_14100 [Mucilaginibacter sp. PPCGB 2223]
MKKIIIIAFAILTTGLVSSCTKDNSVKPASVKVQSTTADKSDVGSGDNAGGSSTGSGDGTTTNP